MSFRIVHLKMLVSAMFSVLVCSALVTTAGAAPSAGDLVLVSASASGEPGNGVSSYGLSTSADGGYVAFASMATNLAPADTDNIVDVFVKDLETGAVHLASQTAAGVKADAISARPSISADGNRVAFTSAADNLSPGDTDGYFDVYVKDLQTGELTLASRTADETKVVGISGSAVISGDGSTVAFTTSATGLSPHASDGESHVYVKDLASGALTLADGGTIARPDEQIGAYAAALSASGAEVAFVTDASGLDARDTDRRADVYVRDLRTGAVRLASVNADGVKGNLPSTSPSLSADGSLVAFASASDNLVPQDTDTTSDVYVKDLGDGSLRLASTDAAEAKANSSAAYPSLSPDGAYLAFSSDATNLGIVTAPLVQQVYRKDLTTGELVAGSMTANGTAGDLLSIEPSISRDGAVVAFLSPATNLAPDAGNNVADVFAKAYSEVVVDTEPPIGSIQASPPRFGPPLGQRGEVELTGLASDDHGLDRLSFSVDDEYGSDQPVIAPVDGRGQRTVNWTRSVSLNTRLQPADKDRVYTVTAVLTDTSGNSAVRSARVIVSRYR